jgi:hypothetical protein
MSRLNRNPAKGSIIVDFKAFYTPKWSEIAMTIDTPNLHLPIAKPNMSPDAIPRYPGRSCRAITMVTIIVEIRPTIMW